MNEVSILIEILRELKTIGDEVPFSDVAEKVELPCWISAGNGQSLIINRKISRLIRDLADVLFTTQSVEPKAISADDWAGIVQSVVGPALAKTHLGQPFEKNARLVLKEVQQELANTEWNYRKRTFIFGCSFVRHPDLTKLEIGPVKILSRETWLSAALDQGQISKTSYRRILSRWSGQAVRERKASRDQINEDSVVKAVGAAPFVCTVVTHGLFGKFAREKAVMAARLALVAVALMWRRPSKAMGDLNLLFDGPQYLRTWAFHHDKGDIFGGWERVYPFTGLPLIDRSWQEAIEGWAASWSTIAEAIAYWLSADGLVERPTLMNQFVQALIWFHEACLEPTPMIAITKFMASLDALACGGKSNGIKALVKARLGVEDDTPIRSDGPSVQKVIDELYSQGRSRLIHGSSDRIGHDWTDSMLLAEQLSRRTLIACLNWAAQHSNHDNPKLMLKP